MKRTTVPHESEHQAQAALFQWAKLHERQHPELQWLYAIPNAAKRTPRAGKAMRDEGLKSGVPDICLPVMREQRLLLGSRWLGSLSAVTYAALYIEMKVGKNKPTAEQERWLAGLRELGNYTAVVHGGWKPASELILAYLAGEL